MSLQRYAETEQFVMDCDWSQVETTGKRAFVIRDRFSGEEVERSSTATQQTRKVFAERTRQRNVALSTLKRLGQATSSAQAQAERQADIAGLARYWAKEAARLKTDGFAQKMAQTFQQEAARFTA